MWDDGEAGVGDEGPPTASERAVARRGNGGGETSRAAGGASGSEYEESDEDSSNGGERAAVWERTGRNFGYGAGRRANRQATAASYDQQSTVTTGSSLLFADACAAFEPESKTMLSLHEGVHMHVGCVAPFMALLQFINPAPRMILNFGMHPHATMAQVRSSTGLCGA